MRVVSINEPQLLEIGRIRMALSEETSEQRLRAITNLKHDVVATHLEAIVKREGDAWVLDRRNGELVKWMVNSRTAQDEAIYEIEQTVRRYDGGTKHGNERKLNVAEHIGKMIMLSISEGKFRGLHVNGGILQQVSEAAKTHNISGAKDADTLRKIWKVYRGVAHLGMAMDLVEDNPDEELNVLEVAEEIRNELSIICPKGTSKPYVASEDQIKFLYITMLSGPRFQNRGLPFNVD